MTRKTKVADLRKFDAAEFLDSEEAIAEYLNEALADDDPNFLVIALGDVARSQSMSKIAEATGLGRESLYKALRDGASPKFDTVQRVVSALGLKLTVVPADEAA